MAAPRKSKRKQAASTTTAVKKRKALGERSVNIQANKAPSPTKKSRASRSNKGGGTSKSSSRRKTMEVGAEYDVYVQEKKDRSGTLHPATYDEDTGGYFFTPKGKKTPIAFDGRRHKIVKKTPQATRAKPTSDMPESSIKGECLEDAFESDGEENSSDSEEESGAPEKKKRTGRALPTRRNAKRGGTKKEIDLDSEVSSEEDDEKDRLLTQREVDPETESSSDEEAVNTTKTLPKRNAKPTSKRNEDKNKDEHLHSDDESTVVTGRKRSGSVVTESAPSKRNGKCGTVTDNNDDIESSSDEEETTTRGGRRPAKNSRRAASRAPKSYKDEDSESSDDETETKPQRGSRAVKSSPKGKPKRRAATRANYNEDKDDSHHSSDDSELDEAGVQGGKSAYAANTPLSKKFMDSFGGNDWRSECVIDY